MTKLSIMTPERIFCQHFVRYDKLDIYDNDWWQKALNREEGKKGTAGRSGTMIAEI